MKVVSLNYETKGKNNGSKMDNTLGMSTTNEHYTKAILNDKRTAPDKLS